jgi:hypothetical protein
MVARNFPAGNGSPDPLPSEENLPIHVLIPCLRVRFFSKSELDGERDPIPDKTKEFSLYPNLVLH